VNTQVKNLILWLAIIAVLIASVGILRKAGTKQADLPFSQFDKLVDKGQVKTAVVKGSEVKGELIEPVDGAQFYVTTLPPDLENYTLRLSEKGVNVKVTVSSASQYFLAFFYILPVLLIIGFWIFFMRQMQSGGNKALTFGKSKARLVGNVKNKVTFEDVAGIEEVKDELQEIIEFLKDPKKFQRLGGKIPKGVLLMGSPGTGKTLLAKAIAGEAQVPFFSISGSEFVELFVGVGASRVRDLFDQAKKNSPCIIFIDEIDAVGRNRGLGVTGAHDEREQTLNQLLVEMDGFEDNDGVILVAATNRPDVLDNALLRPGRFDRRIVVPRPDLRGREAILRVHTKEIKLAEDVDLAILGRGTPGFSGADLANLANEAALRAGRLGRDAVLMKDFEYAKDKVLMGGERRSLILSEEDKKIIAYHEAGHAIVAHYLPKADPIHKISIVPRGMALGLTQQLPVDDRYNYSRAYLEQEIAVMMGGRVAEEIFLGEVTTGAGNDFEKATEMARNMVISWGMSEKMGPLSYKGERDPFGGLWEGPGRSSISEETAREVDEEVRVIVLKAQERAREIIDTHRDQVEAVVEALREKEIVDREDFERLLGERSDDDSDDDEPEVVAEGGNEAVDEADPEPKTGGPLGVPTPTS